MADAIISVVVQKLVDLLHKQAREEIDLLTGIEEKIHNLSTTLKRIQAVLDDAEQRKIKDKSVKAWLLDLEDVSYEMDNVLDEWNYIIFKQTIEGASNDDASPPPSSIRKQYWVRSFTPPSSCFCFKRVVVRRDIAVRVKQLTGKLDFIDKQKNEFSFITSDGVASNPQEWKRVQSTSFIDVSEVFGRVSEKNTLVSSLLSGSQGGGKSAIQILSIIGTGGIGKTTLAQLVYNDDQVKGHFEQRVWVCVSNPFDEIRVAKAIVESLESSSPNLNELDPLLQRIRTCTLGKRFFLVLDDVWTEEQMKWEPFKNSLKHCAPGTTILLTTRSKRVATIAGVTSMIDLAGLSASDSWSLFRQVAFFGRSEIECERLETIGREIVARKCKGFPLAIKTIGSLLRLKTTIEEWQKVMDSNTWELEVAEVDLFPHLYLSYSDLPSPLRRCFSYCAVFPKDETILVYDLITMWNAQGYLNSSGSKGEMEMKGREYFENLAMRSFFQEFRKHELEERIVSCKMHDIVHDFAQFLTKRECLIIEGEMKEKFCENTRHLTWLDNEESNDTLFECNMGQLRSFFAKKLKLETLIAYLQNSLKYVRVLKLDGCYLKELPSEIGNLIHLRYLSLRNNKLRELPRTVYKLYNLITFNLDGCYDLQELPPGIEKLINLRHLKCFNIHNMKYPEGIGELTSLELLSFFPVGRGLNKLGYLKNLNQLGGSLYIHIKDNLDDVTDAKNAHLKSKKRIQILTIYFHENVRVKEDVMEALKPSPNLQWLEIDYYGETRLPTWTTSLKNLRHLSLSDCFGLMSLSPLGILPSLEKLRILGLYQLKSVGPAFLGIRESLPPPAIGFPMLTELSFEFCNDWEEWEDISPQDENNAVPLLPRLRRLIIWKCPKLKALPHRLLHKASSLECIELDYKRHNPCTILYTNLTIAEIKARPQN